MGGVFKELGVVGAEEIEVGCHLNVYQRTLNGIAEYRNELAWYRHAFIFEVMK